ncbi:MAG: hypothetical protein IIA10_09155 [Proteobacteria bacterium]|nr:hypothetical protein [Pseudomonadota bacterium]
MEQVLHDNLTRVPALSRRMRTVGLALPLLILAACGGGGGGGGSGMANRAPTANAGPDQIVAEMATVQLNGSGSDPDSGDTLTYSWGQTGGTTVAITNSTLPQASFTAPDVPVNQPETLTFELTVSDGMASGSDTVAITVQEPLPVVTVSGLVQYEFVPPSPNCNGLNFNGTVERPIRGATVQLIDATTENVIDTMVSSALGEYSFADVDANTMVRLRVRAELKRPGSPSWDVEVRDNVVDPNEPDPPALVSRPLYVLDGTDFDTGSANVTENLTAATGWGTNSYTGARAAAPFAILDSIYSAVQFVLTADATATFAPLDAFWSVKNTSTESGDVDIGALGSPFYDRSIDSLFLRGDADDNTDEFDDHVVLHEWGHYFEDNFSRSDSLGGHHALGERLDARLAFGEGWASALAAMALNDPVFCDTGPAGTNGGFGFNAETGGFGTQGWFNEISIVTFIYDLWDTNDEGNDPGSIGFASLYSTMTGPHIFTEAFTSVFSFAFELRASLSQSDQDFLDSQLDREGIASAGLDIWGSNESNDANARPDVLPVYTDIVPDGTPLRICSNAHSDRRVDDIDGNRERYGNKLSEYRYLRMNVTTQSAYALSMVTVDPVSAPPDGFDCSDPANVDDPNIHMHSDPDISLWQAGQLVWLGFSCEANSEETTTNTLSVGTYVLDIREFRYADPDSPQDFPEQTCFDVTVSPFQ